MGDSTKQNSFHIRLLTLPDHMHVINNMDVKMQIPLPSMQLWEVEDGPVVIEAPSADARIFMDGKWRGMDPWEDEALHIRFTPKSGHRNASVECPLSAKADIDGLRGPLTERFSLRQELCRIPSIC